MYGAGGKRVMEKQRAEEIITKAPDALLWTVVFVGMAKILQAMLHGNSEQRLSVCFFQGNLPQYE